MFLFLINVFVLFAPKYHSVILVHPITGYNVNLDHCINGVFVEFDEFIENQSKPERAPITEVNLTEDMAVSTKMRC